MSADFKQSANLAGKILASASLNPAYVISFTGSPTGGTFTPTITTGVNGPAPNPQFAAITYTTGLTAAAVQTSLRALTGMGTVNVTGPNGGPFTVSIPNALGVATLTLGAALTGGAGPLATVTGTGVETNIYQVPAATATKLVTLSVTNGTGTTGTLAVSVVPAAGTADGTHRVLSSYGLAGNDTVSHEDVLSAVKGAMLDAGAFLSLNCTQPVTYLLTGAEAS